MAAVATQIDLITDDARADAPHSVLSDVRDFISASRECGGLLTMGQAAKVLGVGSNQISVWVARQRIKSTVVLGVKMVSAGEVLALYREREVEIRASGGRGMKAPSLADMALSAWKDIEPLK